MLHHVFLHDLTSIIWASIAKSLKSSFLLLKLLNYLRLRANESKTDIAEPKRFIDLYIGF